jgi:hypothetical protein
VSSWFGLLVLCVGIGGLGRAEQPAAGIPAILASGPERDGRPVWVAAGAAAAEGRLRLDLFGEGSRRNLEEQVRYIAEAREGRPAPPVVASDLQPAIERAPYLSEDLCSSGSVVFSMPEVPRDSFEALVRHARDIVGGRVVGIDQGFVNGLPSSLFEVEIDTVLRTSGEFAASGSLYVVYPYAVFRIGDTTFCREEPRYPYRPQIDDRVLLFPASAPIDDHHQLVWPEPEEVVAEKPGVGLLVAKTLQDEEPFAEPATLDGLIERLRVGLVRSVDGGS